MSTLICFEKRNVRKPRCQRNRNFQMSLPSEQELHTSLSHHSHPNIQFQSGNTEIATFL